MFAIGEIGNELIHECGSTKACNAFLSPSLKYNKE